MRYRQFAGILLATLAPLASCDCEGGDGIRALAPSILVEPNPVNLGVVHPGVLSRRVLMVRNTGEAALRITAVRLSDGAHPGLTIVANLTDIGPGKAGEMELRFLADALGTVSGSILIDSDDPQTPTLEVPILATLEQRPGPGIEVCVDRSGVATACVHPLRIDFGAVPFGATATATITASSVGTAALAIASAEARPGGHPSIAFDPASLMTTLPTGDRARFTVRFTPAAATEVSAVFQIVSDDPASEIVPVIVTGSGVAPGLCPSVSSIDFGTVPIGVAEDRVVTITSCGDVPLSLEAIEVIAMSGEMSLVMPPTLPVSLDPTDSIDVTVRYQPVDGGEDRGQLRVGSALADGLIPMVGRSAACDLAVSPAQVDVGAVATNQSRSRTLLVENAGAVDCTVTRLELAAGTTSEFSVTMQPSLPVVIASGASITIGVEYAPADRGSDTGNLEIASDDPAEPVISVPLAGRRLGIGECSLSAAPDPVTFGVVQLGSTQSATLQLTNTGSSVCTIGDIKLSAASSRMFTLMPATLPWLLQGGASRAVQVEFTPRSVTQEMGTVEVFGLIPISPTLTVGLTGSGAGPKLCPEPNPVVFGTHPVGFTTNRQVTLYSCGSDAVQITAATLPAPTTNEMSIASPPSLPLTIPAGSQATLDLAYVGVDLGRDDGTLRLTSNDPTAPVQDIQLIGASSDTPCGDLEGRICGLDGAGPVAGALVYVDTPNGRVSATTNANGDYVLACLPPGAQMVHAESGQWSTSFVAPVSAYTTTTIPGQNCLDASSANVAVVTGEWDTIETILGGLGVPYELYDDPSYGGASTLFLNPQELAMYDIVFLNCGYDESVLLSGAGLQNVRDFVANGGSLYASDWAYDVIERAWPSYVDFLGDDTRLDAAQTAGNFAGWVDVVDAGLRLQLGGRPQVHITSCCSAVDSGGMGTTTHLEGDRLNDGGTHPLMLGFEPGMGAGRVFYTDFHNNGQADILDIFRWLITQL